MLRCPTLAKGLLALVGFAALPHVEPSPVLAQSPAVQEGSAPLSAAQRREVIEAVAAAYAESYVFQAGGRRIAQHLHRQLSRGRFEAVADPAALATELTREIRSVEADEHIEIQPPSPRPAAAAAPSRAEQFAWVERLRKRNYDFVRVERLPGNVGYLRLDSFPPPELAGPTAAAAMAFLQNSEAMIIDLRENGGGTGDMVQFLASYFFVTRTALLETFRRADDPQTTVDYTLTAIEGQRMPTIEIYLLTSARTFSAAEAFAFALQQQGRAIVVGERTRGGGNAGRYRQMPHGFRAFIPMAHPVSPVTRRSWDRTGVEPDVGSTAENALAVAHRRALEQLLAGTTDNRTREQLQRALAELSE